MSQHYSQPNREADPHALPDVEVFYLGKRDRYTFCPRQDAHETHKDYLACNECPEAGWYWWTCLPGCLPDSEPFGPFNTEAEALAEAQEEN